jgi:hypothetical protein
MRNNLVGNDRTQFFLDVLELVEGANASVTVVIEDMNYSPATDTETHEMDVTRMCLERASLQCRTSPAEGIVIADRAGSGAAHEDMFLRGCLEALQNTTGYISLCL